MSGQRPSLRGGLICQFIRYEVLSDGEFRLLRLAPGTLESPISVSIENRSVSASSETYQALSYVWGTSPNRKSIKCNDGQLRVTLNLFDALRRLRSTVKTSMLWIGAICINQDCSKQGLRGCIVLRFTCECLVSTFWGKGKGKEQEENNPSSFLNPSIQLARAYTSLNYPHIPSFISSFSRFFSVLFSFPHISSPNIFPLSVLLTIFEVELTT